jgi:hemerythrin
MKIKFNPIKDNLNEAGKDIISWGSKYATGIVSIDKQHKELVDLTNKLYHACLNRSEDVDTAFKTAMHRLVEYVRYHFSDEQKLLERIKFPNHMEHKKEHENLIKEILEASKSYSTGNKFVPNHCVRTLKDWIFGHIAVTDKIYASYVQDQKRKGLLTDL